MGIIIGQLDGKQRNLERVFLILFLGTILGCVEIIEFDTERTGGLLIVDGSISAGSGPHYLLLGETASDNRKSFPVNGAEVIITDGEGRSEAYLPGEDGEYILRSQIVQPKVGMFYEITITLADGRIYQSRPESIPMISVQQDSLPYDVEIIEVLNSVGNATKRKVVNVYTDVTIFSEFGESQFFRWDVEEVFLLSPTDFPDPFGDIPPPCYVYRYPSTQDFAILDGSNIQTGISVRQKVATQVVDWTFEEKHYFNVYMVALSKDAFSYWNKVNQTVSSVGTIFDPPPAPIPGNIFNVNDVDEEVLGYFEAVSIDTIRRVFFPRDVNLSPFFECQYQPWKPSYPDRCSECLSVPNSTYERPDYF